MFLKTDYGAILGGLDAPMAKGIVLTDCTKKTKEFSTVKRFSFSSSANAVAFTFDDGAVSMFNARKIKCKISTHKGCFFDTSRAWRVPCPNKREKSKRKAP